MGAVVLGLVSGLSWGVADFLGGLASRRAAAFAVVALSQAAGLVVALVVAAVLRPDLPPPDKALLGAAAGLTGVIGLMAFYRAMAVGSMSVIAPVTALGAAVPVVVDLASGNDPAAVVLAGMLLALAGAALVARAPGPASRAGLGLAVVAALGFGGFFSLLAEAADGESALWSLITARGASVPVALVACAAVGASLAVRGRLLLMVAAAGVLDASANLMFAAGSQRGLTSVVAVLGSLYPVTTVVLAAVLLHERLGRLQAAGAGLALGGVAMIAAG
ncbi:MAG TPA: EamA family transporter [Miltoncostaeaceae bacterium]|nr:EamA family transporter [Miltoncostaeaceae bacterium]